MYNLMGIDFQQHCNGVCTITGLCSIESQLYLHYFPKKLVVGNRKEPFWESCWKVVDTIILLQEYIDSTRSQNEKNIKLKAYMEAMLKDIKRAAHTREEQLTDAVKKYKNVSKTFIKRHEELLVAYRFYS